jgi:hypothetical protein
MTVSFDGMVMAVALRFLAKAVSRFQKAFSEAQY